MDYTQLEEEKMICPKCGNEIKDGARFCPKCGANTADSRKGKHTKNGPARKGGGFKILIIIGCLIVIGLLVGILYLIFNFENDSDTTYSVERTLDDDDGVSKKHSSKSKASAEKDDEEELSSDQEDSSEVDTANVKYDPAESEAEVKSAMPAEEAAPPTGNFVDSTDIHDYEIIVKDIGWDKAYEDCKDRGGYLVRINSDREFDYIKDLIKKEGKDNCVFMLGGGYNPDDGHYHWYYDGVFEETKLEEDNPFRSFWLKGEPSYEGEDKDGKTVEEHYLDMFYSGKSKDFVWNDVPEDLTEYYPGRVAYICEYE